MTGQTTPDDITAAVLASFGRCPGERLGTVMRSLTAHLHAFVKDVGLTEEEWRAAIEVLTATGHITSGKRQEWILWSDALGVSMLVDALANRVPAGGAQDAGSAEDGAGLGRGGGPAGGATESTVQGPFYVPGAPRRGYGERIDEVPAGEPLWVHGTVRSLDGRPLPRAELDIWQNGDNELYAVQDPAAPETTCAAGSPRARTGRTGSSRCGPPRTRFRMTGRSAGCWPRPGGSRGGPRTST